ncbi:hypothetical protein [Streptomyces sp. NBC_01198]|uniref:hypothetical protein n=1 Tax=Streptomyces sp. NBC_01198 TaxID=2903769 RepID=UPI002E10181F|nr:DUF4407 domain-containing protein [Streptomyces sp. NBC_01198]
MSTATRPVPQPRDGTRPPAFRTETTRLLSAGVYFDTGFRTRVIEELVEHEERPVAPSLGIDALPVLAHALRARRREAQTGAWVVLIWVVFAGFAVTGTASDSVLRVPWFAVYALLCAMAWARRSAAGVGVAVFTLDRAMLKEATSGRLKLLLPVFTPLVGVVYAGAVLITLLSGDNAWAGVFFPFLLALPVWLHRGHVTTVMCRELGRTAYAHAPRATLGGSPQWRRIGAAIDREQHSPLTIYDPFRPFIGAGKPYEPWSLAMELKPADPAKAAMAAEPPRLTGREVIDLIKPRMTALRDSAAASRDRLRSLEIDEFVYLPAGLRRAEVVYAAGTVDEHLAAAAGEGGEARRHFLRIRVGAWEEQIVVSILVRVHTQGGMLVLEVVPHVLTPVRPEFRAVDVIADRGQADPVRHALRSLLASPAAGLAAMASLVRTGVAVFRTWLADPEHALPDGPTTSVRELGSVREVSLFQEMDISRYVKTVQDRIASGVRDALRLKGYATGEFEQQIVNVSGGGVYIGAMSGGAVATGDRASAKHTEGGA